jgi:uncharacterized membrane protein YbhN (UPF0104 family)
MKSSAPWLLALKLALVAGILTWLVRTGRLDVAQLSGVRWGAPLALVFLVWMAAAFVTPVRWYLLARARGLALPLATAVQVCWTGYFFTLASPGLMGQDGARLYYATRFNPGLGAEIMSGLALDRLLGFLGLLTVAFGGSLALLASSVSRNFLVLPAAAMALAGALLAGAWVLLRQESRFRRFESIERFATAVAAYRGHKATLGAAFALSCFGHIAGAIAAVFAFRGLGASPGLLTVLAIQPLVTLARVVPLTPLGLGVADAAAEELYGIGGSSLGAEVSMILRAAQVLVALAGLVTWLLPVKTPDKAT